ncbi:MAG: hypothetical protein IJV41_01005 [Oscillospiraceae bacterium]|nr:hypothetical protein [Oscillospiraceae bacterium]
MKNNDEIEIDLLKLFKALWKRALVILLVALITASAVFAFTLFFISPAYDATVSFYVNNSSFSFGSTSFSISSSELSASNSLVSTYIYILKSRTTLEDVISRGGLPYTYEKLSKMVTTNAITGTAAFDVTVRSASPTEAEQIANVIAQVLPDRIAEIVDGSSVRIVDYAIVPAHRAAPSYTKNTVMGFLIGAVIAAGIVTVRFLIDEQNDVVIHSADELRQLYPDIKVLALIPDMRLSEKKGYYYSSYYGDDKRGGK